MADVTNLFDLPDDVLKLVALHRLEDSLSMDGYVTAFVTSDVQSLPINQLALTCERLKKVAQSAWIGYSRARGYQGPGSDWADARSWVMVRWREVCEGVLEARLYEVDQLMGIRV